MEVLKKSLVTKFFIEKEMIRWNNAQLITH